MPAVSALRTEAQGLLKKGARPTANAEDVLRWFNECLRRLQRHTRNPKMWTVTLTATETYTLAKASYPILSLDKVYHIDTGATTGTDLEIVPLDRRWEENTIRFIRARGNGTDHTLYVYPTDLAGTLELHGQQQLDILTGDADIPAIAEDFHDLLPLWVAARFGAQDEDFGGDGRYTPFMSEYLRREREYIGMAGSELSAGGFQAEMRW